MRPAALLLLLVGLLLLASSAAAHALVYAPPSRNYRGPSQGLDYTAAAYRITNTFIPGSPTLTDPRFLTTSASCAKADWCREPGDKYRCCHATDGNGATGPYARNPWRAPGEAPISTPCGAHDDGSHDGRYLPKTTGTVWQLGATVEVLTMWYVNHGGGYAFRLCPASEEAAEACFAQHYIPFADNTTTVGMWNRTAGHYDNYTVPNSRAPTAAGTHWKRNPVPGNPGDFAPPCPGCFGNAICKSAGWCPGQANRWQQGAPSTGGQPFTLTDRLRIPATLAPGEYVLSWRWDTEWQSNVWANCVDVSVAAAADPAPR